MKERRRLRQVVAGTQQSLEVVGAGSDVPEELTLWVDPVAVAEKDVELGIGGEARGHGIQGARHVGVVGVEPGHDVVARLCAVRN